MPRRHSCLGAWLGAPSRAFPPPTPTQKRQITPTPPPPPPPHCSQPHSCDLRGRFTGERARRPLRSGSELDGLIPQSQQNSASLRLQRTHRAPADGAWFDDSRALWAPHAGLAAFADIHMHYWSGILAEQRHLVLGRAPGRHAFASNCSAAEGLLCVFLQNTQAAWWVRR